MAITGIIGYQGSGKTYWMVSQLYNYRLRHPDITIVTNIPGFTLPFGPTPWYIDALDQAFAMHNCVMALDEMHLWANSRDYATHKGAWIQWVSQLRKRQIDLYFTCQQYKTLDSAMVGMAHYTYAVTSVKKLNLFLGHSYEGTKPPKKLGLPLIYVFNPAIAACYPRYAEIKTDYKQVS